MKTLYQITSDEFGTVVLRRRKIAKALRWWLHKYGLPFRYSYFIVS
ncbi:MAG: hypothetical protein JXN62_11835 [Bacteroidales bacterium]|nr:hypothetical protein [Bacteroidales bacterium]